VFLDGWICVMAKHAIRDDISAHARRLEICIWLILRLETSGGTHQHHAEHGDRRMADVLDFSDIFALTFFFF